MHEPEVVPVLPASRLAASIASASEAWPSPKSSRTVMFSASLRNMPGRTRSSTWMRSGSGVNVGVALAICTVMLAHHRRVDELQRRGLPTPDGGRPFPDGTRGEQVRPRQDRSMESPTRTSSQRLTLRAVEEADLGVLFQQQRDPRANLMATFTVEDPTDEARFRSTCAKLVRDDTVTARVGVVDGSVVGC